MATPSPQLADKIVRTIPLGEALTHPNLLGSSTGGVWGLEVGDDTNLCLSAKNGGTSNGDGADLVTCGGYNNDLWNFYTATDGDTKIQEDNFGNNLCLDANSNDYPSNGDAVQVWQCLAGHTEQVWRWGDVVKGGEWYNIGVGSTGSCLDANSNDFPHAGDNVQIWSCNNNWEQEWSIVSFA